MKNLISSLVLTSSIQLTSALPTWPSPIYDQLEYIMYQLSGYDRSGFSDGVSPCSFSSEPKGRIAAAEWVRTAYHDMSTADVEAGTGGLDASIMFETERAENVGSAFNSTFNFMTNYYSPLTSMADLLALGVHTAVRSCSGPSIPMRAGRIDATAAGPEGVPEPSDSLEVLTSKFAKAGFNTSDMIDMVACGHTLGGVHGADFPTIVPPTANVTNNFSHFDGTFDNFDKNIATEYLSSNTSDPLVNGPDPNMNSDFLVFNADGNETISTLANDFQDRCKSILTRMIETVPKDVVLSEVMEPYEIKPSRFQLNVLDPGELSFEGNIRVRTTVLPASNISSVQLLWKDKDGNEGGVVDATKADFQGGSVGGFGETFQFYTFTTTIPSISTFTLQTIQNDPSNTTTLYTNNNATYPYQSNVLYQSSGSCLNQSTSGGTLKIQAAVLSTSNIIPTINLTTQVARQGVVIPNLVTKGFEMEKVNTTGSYDIYNLETEVTLAQSTTSWFDVIGGEEVDGFRATSLMDRC